MIVFETSSPTMNASIIGIPRPAPAAPPTAAMISTCVPGLGPDPMDHPDAERGALSVGDISSGSTWTWPWTLAWNRRHE